MPDPSMRPPDLDAQGQPVRPPDLDAQGNPVGGGMNFAIVNGQRVPVDDGPLDAVSEFGHNINPFPAIQQIGETVQHGLAAAAAAQAGLTDVSKAEGAKALEPAKGILAAQNAVKASADEAWAKGDHVTAVRKYADWLLPIIGPVLDKASDQAQAGQLWHAIGASLGLGASLFGPKALETARIKVPALASNRNPVEAAAVQFGEQQGVPIDAATATGNPFIRNTQKLTAQTPLGSLPAMRTQAAQAEALTRVGQQLADQAHPYPQTPELAGEQLQGALQQKVTDLHGQANTAYETMRGIEAEPGNAVDVPAPKTDEQIAFEHAVNERARVTAGRPVTDAAWQEMRRMRAELDDLPFNAGGLAKDKRNYNAGTFVPRSAGTPLYHDILQAAPGTSAMTRDAVLRSIDRALADGTFTNAAKGALAVAEDRVKAGPNPSSPWSNMGGAAQPTVSMQMPVDLAASKRLLQPVYDRLTRQLPITQQRASPGLKAIQNILDGPDYAPVSQVDQDLSAIKALARGADLPELKSLSQGVAAHAVQHLETQVSKAMERATVRGDEAATALQAGREATTAKYGVAEELRQLRQEPVQAFQQATYANDAGVSRLRRLAAQVPDEIPKIGRAWLDQALTKATSEGGFAHAQRMQADWNKLGPQTKAILFDKPGQVQALDHYFRLARIISENPNPSGSALAIGSWATLQGLLYPPTMVPTAVGIGASGAISAILHSPKAVQLFTRGATLMLGPGKASTAAMSMGIADVLKAAREAGLAGQTKVPAPGVVDPTRPQDQ